MNISTKREIIHTIGMTDKEASEVIDTLMSITHPLNEGTSRLYGLLSSRNS